ncbi:YebC/PmpR family DNA-binding transcriptional regulator [Yinghuangia aomiensis]
MLIECLTDNRNRAASDVRVAMTRNGGSMADPGSVSYMFTRKGVVIVPKNDLSEDDVLGAVLDARCRRGQRPRRGVRGGQRGRATSIPVRTALQEGGHRLRLGRGQLPAERHASNSTRTAPARSSASSSALEDSDDVQNVLANLRRVRRGHGEDRRLSEHADP